MSVKFTQGSGQIDIAVASGITVKWGEIVGLRIGGGAGQVGRIVPMDAVKTDLIVLGQARPKATDGFGSVTGDSAGTVVSTVILGPGIIENINNPTDDNPDLLSRHVWMPTGITVIFDNPDPTGHSISPHGFGLRYIGSAPITGSQWDVYLFSPGESKAYREGKRTIYTEP